MSFQRIFAIVNPAAGQDEPVVSVMNRAFRDHDIEWDMRLTHQTGDGEKLARQAIDEAYDLIVVYGGDGTVMDVVNGMYNSEEPKAILPGGTGNGVAVAINVPDELEVALEQIVQGQGKLTACDVGSIEDRYFLLRVDIGNIVEQIEQQEREDKNQFGVWSYLHAIFKSRLSDTNHTFKLTIDDEQVERDGAAFMIMNLSRIGAFKLNISEKIRPDDGLMDIFVVKDEFRALASVAASAVDAIDFEDVFEHLQGKEIYIETDEPMTVLADGEPFGKTPTTVKIIPEAISLFIPQVETDNIDTTD